MDEAARAIALAGLRSYGRSPLEEALPALVAAADLAYTPLHASVGRPGYALHPFVAYDEARGIDTQVLAVHTPHAIVLAFRGTTNLTDWFTNLQFRAVAPSLEGLPENARVHEGFALATEAVWPEIVAWLASERGDRPVWLTGHSLGAALAHVAAAGLLGDTSLVDSDAISLVTFAAPRVGNDAFGTFLATHLAPRIHRVVFADDLVPRLPPAELGYAHVGTLHHWSRDGECHVHEHDDHHVVDLLRSAARSLVPKGDLRTWLGTLDRLRHLATTLRSGHAEGGVTQVVRHLVEAAPDVLRDHDRAHYRALFMRPGAPPTTPDRG